MKPEYVSCRLYAVTQRLKGLPVSSDLYAEHFACTGCGAPAGFRCRLGERLFCSALDYATQTRVNDQLIAAYTRLVEFMVSGKVRYGTASR